MRRTLPETIAHEGKQSEVASSRSLLDVRLGLECITPVIGGGVRAREPDTVDLVRVPGIRGQLRFWWRALGDEEDASRLFDNEVEIWGGVRGAGRGGAVASRVRISIESIDHPGTDFPAGTHELRPGRSRDGGERPRDGRAGRDDEQQSRLRPLPTWSQEMAGLAYAAFPLMRTKDELDKAQRDGTVPLPTWKVRTGLRFTLRLVVRDDTVDGAPPRSDEVARERILWSVWAWVHFGGIGGRTTRGFGALAPTTVAGLSPEWEARFRRPPADRVEQWLRARWSEGLLGRAIADHRAQRPWTHLRAARLAIGDVRPGSAQARVVGRLSKFRQAVGLGRMESRRGKPAGESYWPEAHVLRVHADNQGHRGAWAHQPPDAARRCISKTETERPWIPARAAFGLPIVMHFMDAADRPAEATLELDGAGGRWMSPLRLRPIACANGQQAPIMLLFEARPRHIKVRRKGESPEVVHLADGAVQPSPRGPLREEGWMAPGDVDSAGAFFDWLVDQEGMQSL